MARHAAVEKNQRELRIGSRLLLLLAVPLVGLLAVTGYGVVSGLEQYRDASALSERTSVGLVAYELVDALQAQRAELVGDLDDDPALDGTIADLRDELSRSAEVAGPATAALVADTDIRLDAAANVANIDLGGRAALTSHGGAIESLLDVAAISIDPRGAVDAAAASTTNELARSQSAAAAERDTLTVLTAEGALDVAGFQSLIQLASEQRSYALLAASTAAPALGIRVERLVYDMNAAENQRREVFAGAATAATPTSLADGLDQRTERLGQLRDVSGEVMVAQVDDLASSSRLLLLLAALAAVATVLISALLLRRAIHSIARPLRDLAIQAEEVANVRLPNAVAALQDGDGVERRLPALRTTGAAEVYSVAAAFNDVQDTALRLAGEQAASRRNQAEALTNLGRRNQTLLARQLDFISTLETTETDPEFLAHLFQLDHLASRMRRNAESLLILAGTETPRRRRTPAGVGEVVRAAMSQVEDFERVRIGHLRDATIVGPTVVDVIHLLSELIENALSFSPPDTTVEIDGRPLGGGYQLAVIDRGVGMSDVELMAANQRLGASEELEGMPTRYLGQYVVARLAVKIGASVRLQPSTGSRGVTAIVNLPAAALIGAPDRSSIASPLPGSLAAREQGPVPFAPGAGVSSAGQVEPFPAVTAPAEVEEPQPAQADAEFRSSDFSSSEFDPADFEILEPGADPVASLDDGMIAPESDSALFLPESVQSEPVQPEPIESAPAEPTWAEAWSPDPVEGIDVPARLSEPDPAPSPEEFDPWAAFSKAAFEQPAVPPTDVPPTDVPPAPPVDAPQVDWSPFSTGDAAVPIPAAADTVPPLPITPTAPVAAAGLPKRVPGASLPSSSVEDTAAAAAPSRSAESVRSMLSSFQAGRTRQGHEHVDEPMNSATGTDAGPPEQADTQLDDSQDWRSSK